MSIVLKLIKQAQAPIPTKYGIFQAIAYAKAKDDRMPHMVLFNPNTDLSKTVNIRVHSECITGDLFGSYRCECGEQLDWAMDYIAKNGGAIIYLRQEGRGIGIINKLHAYTKQDEGYDTAEANKLLGFGYDDRTYEDAATILQDLKIKKVNLLTNNPDKVNALNNCIVSIEKRIPVEIIPRKENFNYLKTKKDFFGHKLNKLGQKK
ncbi:MAG: GTP cyclohydrolase II [Saprospiraceae bacterium]